MTTVFFTYNCRTEELEANSMEAGNTVIPSDEPGWWPAGWVKYDGDPEEHITKAFNWVMRDMRLGVFKPSDPIEFAKRVNSYKEAL